MNNHPNRSTRMSYWMLHPRRFANEFIIGIAMTVADAEQYEAEGYHRVNRETALYELSKRPQNGEQLYRTVTINGEDIASGCLDSYQIARNIRTGRGLWAEGA